MASIICRSCFSSSPLQSMSLKLINPILTRKTKLVKHDEFHRSLHKSLYEDDFISGFGSESSSESPLVEGNLVQLES